MIRSEIIAGYWDAVVGPERSARDVRLEAAGEGESIRTWVERAVCQAWGAGLEIAEEDLSPASLIRHLAEYIAEEEGVNPDAPLTDGWVPTHLIEHDGERVLVMLTDATDGGPGGPAYTAQEWATDDRADYEYSPEHGWTCLGRPVDGPVHELETVVVSTWGTTYWTRILRRPGEDDCDVASRAYTAIDDALSPAYVAEQRSALDDESQAPTRWASDGDSPAVWDGERDLATAEYVPIDPVDPEAGD